MRWSPLVVALVVAAALLAGCTSPSNPTSSAPPARSRGDILRDSTLNATHGPSAGGHSMLLMGEASPGWTQTSFLWTATAADTASQDGIAGLVLEGLPVQDRSASVDAWTLDVFSLSGAPKLVASELSVPMNATTRIAVLGAPSEVPASFDAFYLEAIGVGAGPYALVLNAHATSAQPFGILLHPLDTVFPTGDPDGDVKSYAGAVALPVHASGHGFQVALDEDFTDLAVLGIELRTAPMAVEDRYTRIETGATVRDVTLTAKRPGAGYTFLEALYFGAEAHGTWSVDGSLHGTPVAAHSLILEDEATEAGIAEAIVVGLPLVVGQADGSKDTSVALHVQVANVDELEILVDLQVDYGTSLTNLTGVAAAPQVVADTGLAGNVPPASLSLLDGHPMLTVPGGATVVLGNVRAHAT